jgi:hypothetical protein
VRRAARTISRWRSSAELVLMADTAFPLTWSTARSGPVGPLGEVLQRVRGTDQACCTPDAARV